MGEAITSTTPSDGGRRIGEAGSAPSWLERRHLPATAAAHALIFAVSLLAAFGLAYNFHRSGHWIRSLYFPMLALALPIKLAVFGRMRQFRGSWRYVGMYDLLNIAWASWVGSFLFFLAFFVIENVWMNRFGTRLIDREELGTRLRQSVFLLDWAATIALVSACRVGARLYVEEIRSGEIEKQSRVLILGAGDTGETILREILRMPGQPYKVVGFLDDRAGQRGRTIHGVEVLGTPDDIAEIRDGHVIDELLIALPSPTPRDIRRIVEICEGSNLRFRLVPGVADLIDGRMHVSGIREVDIEDLLGREPVALDTEAVARELSGKRILVTGAGGSIGAEICRQVARFGPERLILVEQAENNLFEIDRGLRAQYPELTVDSCVADICDGPRLRSIIGRARPAVVFHAAAHKHVPMMESNPGEAVKNNIGGTRIIADVAAECGVGRTVMISTDKAVNPTSVMGCTKRIAEMYVQQLSARGAGSFITVRFGNVLGSSGSVVPIFREQIARGGPVTVTHPEMVRYFMTIAEAAQLVLQAGVMGSGGEIYVLDMGEPVKIVDLAKDMITLSGLRPGEDIEIVFTGLRPGEKLFEELSMEGEDVSRTTHPKIGIWRHRPENFERIREGMERLQSLADGGDGESIRHELKAMVAEYRPGS